jgi:hypothetical protein
MERAPVIDAVKVVRARRRELSDETYAAIAEARAAGTSQKAAHLANALERARVDSILPTLPDDLEMMRLHHLEGKPRTDRCELSERPAT